jgi:hypothetical protein
MVGIVIVAALLSLWRWSMPIVFGYLLVWSSYEGHWLMFPYAVVVAGEIVSAWTGDPWTMVMWRVLRPKPEPERMTRAEVVAFERAAMRDLRRVVRDEADST